MSVSVSTHVLDTAKGKPASGVRVELSRAGLVVASGETDGDGRIQDLAPEIGPGRYQLSFWPPSDFFARVTLEVELTEGHYHLPLLVSPYGCVTYRGS